jgi:hypothetical protein
MGVRLGDDPLPPARLSILRQMNEPKDRDSSAPLPYPESLCHRCAAPPRYILARTSVFIMCPLLPAKYPRQPVRECALYRPLPGGNDQ